MSAGESLMFPVVVAELPSVGDMNTQRTMAAAAERARLCDGLQAGRRTAGKREALAYRACLVDHYVMSESA